MIWTYPDHRIAIFAREPVPGRVKTRLQPHLGEAGALALYRAMLTRTVATVRSAKLAPHALWVSSNPSHKEFLSLCSEKDIYSQSGANLGRRMDHAATSMLAARAVQGVVIIGTDCPALGPDYLEQALAALAAGQDVVLGPADDGGYVLIGLRQPRAEVFEGIDWGSERVLAQTEARLAESGLSYQLLEPLWDVDRPEDLPRLESLQPPLVCDWQEE